jgi:hypothetical protein
MWAKAAAAASRQGGSFGFATGSAILDFDSTTLARFLDGVATSGASVIRVDFSWPVIQPSGPSAYNWSITDRIVDAARARGLNVIGILDYTPAWARPSGTTQFNPPTDPAAFARFSAAAAGRYRGRVATYEVWNEPNQSYFWRPEPNAAAYTALLRAAYPAIKAADSGAFVLGGATTGGWSGTSGPKLDPVVFLDRVYAAGGGGYFDAWSHHPYTFNLAYSPSSAWSKMAETSPSISSVMAAHGDAGKPLWATEFGASTADISEAAQAQLVKDATAKWSGYSWAGALCWYSFKDTGKKRKDSEQNFGLVRYDWSAKPALQAYRSAVTGR